MYRDSDLAPEEGAHYTLHFYFLAVQLSFGSHKY